jgi:macrolide-specific efflux system membrane fusion protein
MTAQVFFVVAEAKQVPVVPVTALRQARGGGKGARYSVRVRAGGKVVERPVEVGVMTRLNAEIKAGLEVGDELMIDAPPAAPRVQPPGGNRGPRI